VFGDRDSDAYLQKFAWTKITRHTLVKGWASPDDPALTGYWAARRRRRKPPLHRPGCGCSSGRAGAARSAAARCSAPTGSHSTPTNGSSGPAPSPGRSPARRSPTTRTRETTADPRNSASSHTGCRRRPPDGDGSTPALSRPRPGQPQGLPEPPGWHRPFQCLTSLCRGRSNGTEILPRGLGALQVHM